MKIIKNHLFDHGKSKIWLVDGKTNTCETNMHEQYCGLLGSNIRDFSSAENNFVYKFDVKAFTKLKVFEGPGGQVGTSWAPKSSS